MKIVIVFVGTLAALGFAFVGMPMMMFGAGAPGLSPAPEIATIVSGDNAKRATNLTSSQRKKAMDLCLATFREQRKPGTVDEENTAKLRASLEGEARSKCGCMINAIADRSNTMAFAMAMSTRFEVVKDLDPAQIGIGEQINQSAFDDIAQKVGLTEQEMKPIRVRSLDAVVEAARVCG